MNKTPTTQEALNHLSEHFGMTMADTMKLMRTPAHPSNLRDTFAARAMQAWLHAALDAGLEWINEHAVANKAYLAADAMIVERGTADSRQRDIEFDAITEKVRVLNASGPYADEWMYYAARHDGGPNGKASKNYGKWFILRRPKDTPVEVVMFADGTMRVGEQKSAPEE